MLFGANYVPLVREGQLHRLLSSTFLHLNPMHLLLNMVALVAIGPALERDYGRLRFAFLYIASGVVGSLGSLAWHWRDPVVSAGASGALCGAIAAGAVSAHLAGAARAAERRTLIGWALATLGFGVLLRADNAAHVGGLAAGAAMGWLLRRAVARPKHDVLPGAFVVLVALVSFGGAVFTRDRSESAAELVNRGVELAQGGDEAAAIVVYRRALALEPADAVAHFDLGLALERQGQYEDAIFHLSRALELEPSDAHRRALAGAHVNHGVALAKAGDSAGAIAAYRRALELDTQSANTHRNLAIALARNGDKDAAISTMRRALELDSSTAMKQVLAGMLADVGIDRAHEGKHESAAALYREAMALDPAEWRFPLNLGLSLLAAKQFDAAVSALERAHELAGSDTTQKALADAIEARQEAREKSGDLMGALDDLGRSTVLRIAAPDAGMPAH